LYNENDMKNAQAKPKQPSGKTKLSGLRALSGKPSERYRSDARLSEVLKPAKVSKHSSAPAKSGKSKSRQVSEHVMEYAGVLAHAVDTFGSRMRANAWLNRPNRIFNNQSPLQVLTQDPEAVEEELVRIDDGIFN
jgi:uncharacterized protein (DUF2384 family)